MDDVSAEIAASFGELSRELRCVVDSDGVITWADARGEHAGLARGAAFSTAAVPGCEDKARELCRRGGLELVERWELPLVVAGAPTTVLFTARPIGDGRVALLGSLIAQDYADAIAEGNGAIHEIVALNREITRKKLELEESNRGIRALHAELEQQADKLRATNEVKSRLVAGVSHEFRTPLHSILGLSRLLLDGADGPLNRDQRTQVEFMRSSAEELSKMINEMLDLARVEAGSSPVRADHFELGDFMSAMRGTMMPLVAAGSAVSLVFAPSPDVPLETDQSKLGQIIRNLISNALKFTERGTVHVGSTVHNDHVEIAVKDSGIGIAPENLASVFEEFVQIDSPLQRTTLGTGLGLPLSRKLAELLGGTLEAESVVGAGSTFTLSIPLEHPQLGQFQKIERAAEQLDPSRSPILVVEDDRSTVFVYERFLSLAGFQVIPVRTTADAREALMRVKPSAILLDVMLEGEDTWGFLAELKKSPATQDIPVLVCTVMNRESRARALGADEFWLKPVDPDLLIRKLKTLSVHGTAKVLVVDDEPAARYLVKKMLAGTPYELAEAGDGMTGVKIAREWRPDVILLDFLLDEMTAFDVLDQLKADPQTRTIPVIIVTSHVLPLEDRDRLGAQTEAILSKEHLSRELAINRIRDALSTAGIRQRAPRKEPG